VHGDTIRSLIREVLGEELKRLKAERGAANPPPRPQVREEVVAIESDSDLAGFVARLLELTRDGQTRREISEGRYVFRLGPRSAGRTPGVNNSPAAPADRAHRIEAGMVTERQIDALPAGTTRLVISKSVRLTPLARDRLRQRGVAIERAS
jgi:hypothetical protein